MKHVLVTWAPENPVVERMKLIKTLVKGQAGNQTDCEATREPGPGLSFVIGDKCWRFEASLVGGGNGFHQN